MSEVRLSMSKERFTSLIGAKSSNSMLLHPTELFKIVFQINQPKKTSPVNSLRNL